MQLHMQSNEWKHPGSPFQRQCTVDNVVWRQCSLWCTTLIGLYCTSMTMVNAAKNCNYFNAAFRTKYQYLLATNPFIPHVHERCLTANTVTDLLHCSDTGTSTTLTRYESVQIKEPLWGKHYITRDTIMHATVKSLHVINRYRSALHKCNRKW